MSPQPLKKRLILSKKTKESVKGIHAVPYSHSATMWIQSNNARTCRAQGKSRAVFAVNEEQTKPVLYYVLSQHN